MNILDIAQANPPNGQVADTVEEDRDSDGAGLLAKPTKQKRRKEDREVPPLIKND